MEIFILVFLVLVMIIVFAKVFLGIQKKRPIPKNKWEEGEQEKKPIWDIEKTAEYYDPSNLDSPLSKIPIIESRRDDS
jgi:hypothetical protein